MPNPFNPDSLEKDPPVPPPGTSCSICGGKSHDMVQLGKVVLCEECNLAVSDIGAGGLFE